MGSGSNTRHLSTLPRISTTFAKLKLASVVQGNPFLGLMNERRTYSILRDCGRQDLVIANSFECLFENVPTEQLHEHVVLISLRQAVGSAVSQLLQNEILVEQYRQDKQQPASIFRRLLSKWHQRSTYPRAIFSPGTTIHSA